MSYPGCNYSPYYQQQSQQSVQQPPNPNSQTQSVRGSNNAPYYRSLGDVPAHGSHIESAEYSTDTSSSEYASGYGYRPSGASQDMGERAEKPPSGGAHGVSTYYDISGQSYVDTSALASLAQASALGRTSPTAGPNSSAHGHSHAPSTEGTVVPAYSASGDITTGYSQLRADNRASVGANRSTVQDNASSPNAASNAANALAQTRSTSHRASPQLQYQPVQNSDQNRHTVGQSHEQGRISSNSSYTAIPQASASSAAHTNAYLQPPKTGLHQSYSTTTAISSTPQNRNGLSGTRPGSTESYAGRASAVQSLPAPQQVRSLTVSKDQIRDDRNLWSTYAENRDPPRYNYSAKVTPQQHSAGPKNPEAARGDLQHTANHSVTPQSGNPNDLQPTVNRLVALQSSTQHSITVDPSQAFNLQEYQRRKTEADTDNARKAAEERKVQRISMKTIITPTQNGHGVAVPDSKTKQAAAEAGSKEQIRAEIKAMIEKMREYKAKDPALFSEVWEQFKNVQPPVHKTSQTPLPFKEPQLGHPGTVNISRIALPGFENGPLPSPSPTLNQEAVLSLKDAEQLPDLGKFPALRRRRMKSDKKKLRLSLRASDVQGIQTKVAFEASAQGPLPNKGFTRQTIGSKRPSIPTANEAHNQDVMRHALQSFQNEAVLSLAQSTGLITNQRMSDHLNPQGGSSEPTLASYTHTTNVPNQPSSGTVWQEDRKASISIAAKYALEMHPANAGKTISADDIRSLLDRNPSYHELCQILESKGFKFERSEFARSLLSAVPNTRSPNANTENPIPHKLIGEPDSGTPPRSRGRPREDGLPPIQTQARPAKNLSIPYKLGPNGLRGPVSYAPVGYSAEPGLRSIDYNLPESTATSAQAQASASIQPPVDLTASDFHDQILAIALKSAISQIDSQSNGQIAAVQPHSTLRWGDARQIDAGVLRKKYGLDTQCVPEPSFQPPSIPLPRPDSESRILIAKEQTSAPRTKEQMARKRDFGEIVDLAQQSDEELTYQRRRARLFLDLLNNSQTENIKDTAQDAPPTSGPTIEYGRPVQNGQGVLWSKSHTSVPALKTKADLTQPEHDLSQFKATNREAILRTETLRTAKLVEVINPNDALKKSAYNLKTLARDILISRGTHPTEKPLNWHLDGLRKKFPLVTVNSDLSTFRWDLVDPGGPNLLVTAQAEAHDADDEADNIASISTTKRGSSYMTVTADHVGTIDKAANTFTTVPKLIRGRPRGRSRGSKARSKDDTHSGSHGESANMVSPPPNSRGSRGAQSHLQPSTTHKSLQQNEAPVVNMVDSSANNDRMSPPLWPSFTGLAPTDSTPSVNKPTDGIQATKSGTVQAPSHSDHFTASLAVRIPSSTPDAHNPGDLSQKRRGRPPGSTNKAKLSDSGQRPKPRGRPPGSKTGTPTRGRPVGVRQVGNYRTTVPPDGVGVILPSRFPSTSFQALSHVEANAERSGKWTKGRPSRQATSPSFQIFNCRWKGCSAQLHNLETLRKHVFKVHGKKAKLEAEDATEDREEKLPCFWLGCKQEGIFSSTTGPLRFQLMDVWEDHIEKRHLQIVAQELGDGPSTHPSDVEPSSYLSDSQGRQVTPLARTNGPPDPLPPGSGRSPTRAYHKAHSNITKHQKTQAELNSYVATKEVAGVFVGGRVTGQPEQHKEESGNEVPESESDSD